MKPNNRLKLIAPSVHASCLAVASFLAGGKKRAPRPQLSLSVRLN
jgi:hypothetical protein